MSSGVVCLECLTPYDSYEGNFHKLEKSSTGYTLRCVKCLDKRLHNRKFGIEVLTELKFIPNISSEQAEKHLDLFYKMRNQLNWEEPQMSWKELKNTELYKRLTA